LLQRYALDDADVVGRKDTVMVQELVYLYHVGTGDQCGHWSGNVCDTFFIPPFPKELRTDFVFIGRIHVDHFQLVRYRSDHPVALRTSQIFEKPKESIVYRLDE
jgi:hypothetical protein